MKRLFILVSAAITFAGCTSTRQYSSVSEPVGGTRALDPIVSTPRNWSKPVKGGNTAHVEVDDGTRIIQGTSWERTWHGE